MDTDRDIERIVKLYRKRPRKYEYIPRRDGLLEYRVYALF